MPTLERSAIVLVKPKGWSKGVDRNQVFFTVSMPDDEELHRSTELQFDKVLWEEMGAPEVVTVTIEVGDKLNRGYGSSLASQAPDAPGRNHV